MKKKKTFQSKNNAFLLPFSETEQNQVKEIQ